MFANYQFSVDNENKLNDICKKYRENASSNSISSSWSLFSKNIPIHCTFSHIAENEPLNTKLESKDFKEIDSDVIFLSSDSETDFHPKEVDVIVEGHIVCDQIQDANVSIPASQLSQISFRKQKIVDIPDSLSIFQEDVIKLRDYLDSNNATVESVNFISDLDMNQMTDLTDFLKLNANNETSLSLFCDILTTKMAIPLSYDCGILFFKKCLFPKISKLEKNASRQFIVALSKFCSSFSLIFTYMVSEIMKDSEIVQSAHALDLVIKLVKDICNVDNATTIFSNVVTTLESLHENHIMFIESLLDKKMNNISPYSLETFIALLIKSKDDYAKNLKFAKMISKFIQSFKKMIEGKEKEQMLSVIDSNQTFLKRSLQNALKK